MLWRWDYLILGILLLAELSYLGEAVAAGQQRSRRRLRTRKLAAGRRNQVTRNRTSARKLKTQRAKKTTTPAKIQSRIVGGTTTQISTAPYLVQVRRDSALCGGSLLTDRWVITAAHCVKGYSASQYTIRAGTSTLDSGGVTSSATALYVAPKFTKAKMNMDAALIKTAQSLSGTNIESISMATARPKPGSKVRLAGWGVTKEGSTSASQTLRAALVTVTKQKKCQRDYRSKATITTMMFCARAIGKDSCSGDSGGSVVQNNTLVGIVSFGYGCARSGYPGVYTSVAAIRAWANKIMANN